MINKTERRLFFPAKKYAGRGDGSQRAFLVEAVEKSPGIPTKHLRRMWEERFPEQDLSSFSSRLLELEREGFIRTRREADLFQR